MINFKEKFLQLTQYTCPHGYESIFKEHLPTGYSTDVHGNHFICIGDNPTTMFTSHLDTACSKMTKVKHVIKQDDDRNVFIGTDGNTILGADDKAGMVIMLHMIENNIPGLYYFFLGEEVGCVGSKRTAKDMWLKGNTHIKKVVSFDRRGYDSVITHQFYGRCCSDIFANELANQLNINGIFEFKPDDSGICTDSIQFQDFIPECTNISVGYFNEHTGSEIQNIKFLEILGDAVLNVDWENLPINRNPSIEEDWKSYKPKSSNSKRHSHSDYDDIDYHDSDFDVDDVRELTFSDEFFLYTRNNDNIKTKHLVAKERIQYEIEIIGKILISWGYAPEYDKIDWNGNVFKYSFQGEEPTEILNRYDLSQMDQEFSKMKSIYLRETDEQLIEN